MPVLARQQPAAQQRGDGERLRAAALPPAVQQRATVQMKAARQPAAVHSQASVQHLGVQQPDAAQTRAPSQGTAMVLRASRSVAVAEHAPGWARRPASRYPRVAARELATTSVPQQASATGPERQAPGPAVAS